MHFASSACRRGSSTVAQHHQRMAAPTVRMAASTPTSTLNSNTASPRTTYIGATISVAAAASSGSGSTAATAVHAANITTAPATAPTSLDFLSLRGVLFDVDGTLVESDPLHFLAFQEILAEVGFNGGQPIDEGFFRLHISGRHNPEIAADLFPAWDEQRRTAFYLDKEERFRRMAAAGLEPLQGLREFLEWMRQRGLRCAAVTNAPRANAEMMLAGLGLESCFEHLVLGEECTRAKPHPDPYLTAMELLGLTPAEVVVFEDSPSGVTAGVAAGAPVVALTTGQEPEVLRRAGAVWVVRDFRDVMAAVRAAEAAQASGNGSASS